MSTDVICNGQVDRFVRAVAAFLIVLPSICSATVSGIEAQNLADDGRDFAKELRLIEQCKPPFNFTATYRKVILDYHLQELGKEKFAYFKQGFSSAKIAERQAAEPDCLVTLFNAGKSHQSMGVALAVKRADAELIPRKLFEANQAITFGAQIADKVSRSFVKCIPDVFTRRELLDGFRPLLVNYMQKRFGLRSDFEKKGTFADFIDLFEYESATREEGSAKPDKFFCSYAVFEAGQAVRLVEQLAELKPTPTGIWLDRRLRGVK